MEPVSCIAGIDVHKKMLAVVVRKQCGDAVEYIKRAFGTTKSEIENLAAWLQHHGVTDVVMESTAQYWRPVWHGLEPHFHLHLTHPMRTRAPRGRKRDFRDAQRLADRWHSKDLEESFIPGAEQRAWRALTRGRVQLRRKITLVRNHVEGLLEHGGIKLTAVVSDAFGVSGWAILEKIAAGTTDVEQLLVEARGQLRKKKEELREALAGRLEPAYQILLKQHMRQVQLYREQIEQLNETLATAMRDFVPILVRLMKVPGIDLYAAEELLAEIGPQAAAFPTAEQFASWVGLCPGSQESAGINHSDRSAKGNRYLRHAFCEIAWPAIRTKDTFFSALFHRLKPRLGGKGAAWAVAHRIGKVVWLILHEQVEYEEKGQAPLNESTLARKLRRLARQLTRQGVSLKGLIEKGLIDQDLALGVIG